MNVAYIVDAVRTAGGRRNGKLASWHPVDLGAEVINALLDRTGIDPNVIDDAVFGCVTQAGEQTLHLPEILYLLLNYRFMCLASLLTGSAVVHNKLCNLLPKRFYRACRMW